VDPPTEPSLPPGTISFSEWRDLKDRYTAWGGEGRKRKPIRDFYHTDKPFLLQSSIPDLIREVMTSYHRYTKDKRILLHKQADPTDHIAKRYCARGTDAYAERIAKRLRCIREDWDSRPNRDRATMITIAPRAIGSIWAIHKQIRTLWPAFTDWMRHRFIFTRSIWAIEPTQRHYTHYHYVISGWHVKGLLKQTILEWFRAHGVDIEGPGVKVSLSYEVKGGRDPIGYASKYIAKGNNDLLWQGMLWMSGTRGWGVSRGLGRGGAVTKSEGKWTYCGVCTSEWFRKYRSDLVWGDVLPEKLIADLAARDLYYSDVY